jgi:aryl-alcohol dehydrogenase-like predicted oxidoreductase
MATATQRGRLLGMTQTNIKNGPASVEHAEESGSIARRILGAGGLAVSAIGLGCMGMTGFYGEPDDEQSLRTLHRALDLGCNFWDSSDAYGPHTNERLLSRVLADRRNEVLIATKFGVSVDPETLRRSVNGRPENVKACCEGSLKRLGVDQIDLYYQHRVDPTVPIEETVGAMAELVRAGKVRCLGLSEASAETIRKAHAVHPIAAVQIEYSLWSRGVETDVLGLLRELGIALVAYAPLGHGFLTGRYKSVQDFGPKDFRRTQPRFTEPNIAHNLKLVERIQELATVKGISPAQLALAWTLHRADNIIPIVGTKSVRHLEENLAAANVRLSADELLQIEDGFPEPAGERYDPGGMRTVGI